MIQIILSYHLILVKNLYIFGHASRVKLNYNKGPTLTYMYMYNLLARST